MQCAKLSPAWRTTKLELWGRLKQLVNQIAATKLSLKVKTAKFLVEISTNLFHVSVKKSAVGEETKFNLTNSFLNTENVKHS